MSVFFWFRTTARAPVFYMEEKTILFSNIYATSFGAGAHEKDHATRILSLCQGIFTDWSIFSVPFLLWKKGGSSPVTQWRQLAPCDWSWHSHGSLTLGKFDLKISGPSCRKETQTWSYRLGVVVTLRFHKLNHVHLLSLNYRPRWRTLHPRARTQTADECKCRPREVWYFVFVLVFVLK